MGKRFVGLARAAERRAVGLAAITIVVGAEAPCLRELALERAPRVVGVGGDAVRAQLLEPARARARAAPPSSSAMKTSTTVRLRRRRVRLLEREQEPLDPGAEAERRRRRPADLLDQAVVAAAAADRRLRAVLGADELEGRARVVVEPAHERRHELVGDAVGVEVARGPPRSARGSRRRARRRSPAPRAAPPARAAAWRRSCRARGAGCGAPGRASPRRARPRVLVEPVPQPLDVGRAAVRGRRSSSARAGTR